MRALQARALCGGPEQGQACERATALLRRLKGTPEQLAEFLRDRNGVPTVDCHAPTGAMTARLAA